MPLSLGRFKFFGIVKKTGWGGLEGTDDWFGSTPHMNGPIGDSLIKRLPRISVQFLRINPFGVIVDIYRRHAEETFLNI